MVYDIASRDTFTHVASWLRDARTLAGMDVSTVLIGVPPLAAPLTAPDSP